jgi:hypothetical protein
MHVVSKGKQELARWTGSRKAVCQGTEATGPCVPRPALGNTVSSVKMYLSPVTAAQAFLQSPEAFIMSRVLVWQLAIAYGVSMSCLSSPVVYVLSLQGHCEAPEN